MAGDSPISFVTSDSLTPSSTNHPTLTVTNIKTLVPLILDIDKIQYTLWATLFRNTTKVYNVLDHIDPKVKKPEGIDSDLWGKLDAIVLQWLYGTISIDLLYKNLDDKSHVHDSLGSSP